MGARGSKARAIVHEPSTRRHTCKRCRQAARNRMLVPSQPILRDSPKEAQAALAACYTSATRPFSAVPRRQVQLGRQLQRGRGEVIVAERAFDGPPEWHVT